MAFTGYIRSNRRGFRIQESITTRRTVVIVLDAYQSFSNLFALKFLLVNL